MKKFSRTATAALGVVAALGVAACHPPGEVDSFDTSAKDNASTFTNRAPAGSASTDDAAATTTTIDATGLPQYIDCAAAPEAQPVQISLNCVDNSDVVTNIEWTEWTESSAQGTATRVANGETTENVTVELSTPEQSTQGVEVFTTVTIDGVQVAL